MKRIIWVLCISLVLLGTGLGVNALAADVDVFSAYFNQETLLSENQLERTVNKELREDGSAQPLLVKASVEPGILAVKTADFDGDGQAEMLVIRLEEGVNSEKEDVFNLTATMVENHQGNLKVQGKCTLGQEVLYWPAENTDVFVKNVEDHYRIYAETITSNPSIADGIRWEFTALAYENQELSVIENFETIGSSFDKEDIEEFNAHELIRNTGLTVETVIIEDWESTIREQDSATELVLNIASEPQWNDEEFQEFLRSPISMFRPTIVTQFTREDLPIISEEPVEPAEPGAIRVFLQGTLMGFEPAPFIEEGRTLVPMRAIFEALGASVTWDGDTRSVEATNNDTIIRMTMGSKVVVVNGQEITLEVAPQIVQERTFIPLRVVAESFGAQVTWDDENRAVHIQQP